MADMDEDSLSETAAVSGSLLLTLPWRGRVGSHGAQRDARRGGVTVFQPGTASKERLSPHPAALRTMLRIAGFASTLPLQGRE
jgi:hypothetical protein